MSVNYSDNREPKTPGNVDLLSQNSSKCRFWRPLLYFLKHKIRGKILLMESIPHHPTAVLFKHNKSLLTFIICKLQVMVHGGHKFFNDKASYNGCQIAFTLHFACKGFNIMIWKEGNSNRGYGWHRVNCYNPSH